MRRQNSTRWARLFLVSVVAALVLTVACSGGPKEPASKSEAATATTPAASKSETGGGTGAISAEAMKEAANIFDTRCMPCHGAKGAGDGPASKGLTPPPRNFQDSEWQKSVTDEHIEKIIKYGGAAVGKSPMMPANPDLSAKDEVVKALRVHIRELSNS
ncbi:c-type cytochrome [bacterium]|nr:c-type cytochrome [bacterium]MCB9480118.1 c-type cytochrome [Deltaproteobacteria bacterium]